MDNNDKIRERLKNSFINANNIIKLSRDIEGEIENILGLITEITNAEVSTTITENIPKHPLMSTCKKIAYLIRQDESRILFGYAIDSAKAFPVILETEVEYYECPDMDAMKDTILSIIENKSLVIMRMASGERLSSSVDNNDDIPF